MDHVGGRPTRPRCLSALPANIDAILKKIADKKAEEKAAEIASKSK